MWWLDPQEVVGDSGASSGWLKGNGADDANSAGLLLYWQTADQQDTSGGDVVIFMVEAAQVTTPMQAWLRDWQAEKFDAVISAGGPDQLLGPTDVLAVAGEVPQTSADQVQSLRTRFGEWQVQSWDRRKTVVNRDARAVKVALAGLVLLAGSVAFFALRQALRLAAQRVSFVNQVSHELRTPLTNILLNTDLAAEEASPSAQRRLNLVRDEAERLKRLIDNVLTFSMLHRGKHERSRNGECNVVAAIDELLMQFSSSLKRRGLAVERFGDDEASMAAADEDSVAQIIGNLISNAEKYAHCGRILKLDVRAVNSEVVICVSDCGPGIASSQRERIFDAFHRLDDRVTEGSSGTGLGLSLARSLAESHGGSLRLVESGQSSTGATFELRLPLADAKSDTVIDFPKAQAS